MKRPVYQSIPRVLSGYRLVGMSTLQAFRKKTEFLPAPGTRRTAVVVLDAFRCSSTLLACFSSGVAAAVLQEKGLPSGTSSSSARALADAWGLELVLGGELHGKPVPGGIVGNSPIDACDSGRLNNRLLHFQSTNFAKVFVEVCEYAAAASPGMDVYVIGFPNVGATAKRVISGHYDAIYVVCAGFYDCLALEDMILAGSLISRIAPHENTIDDEALAMLGCYRTYQDDVDRYKNSWSGRILQHLGKWTDVDDIVDANQLPPLYLAPRCFKWVERSGACHA